MHYFRGSKRPVGNFFKETLFEILSRGSLDRISAIEIVKKSLAVPEISLLLLKMPPWDPSVRGYISVTLR